MMASDHSSKDETLRCFGRLKGRELTASELDQVAGGTSYTGISNFRWVDENGNAEFEYGDISY